MDVRKGMSTREKKRYETEMEKNDPKKWDQTKRESVKEKAVPTSIASYCDPIKSTR